MLTFACKTAFIFCLAEVLSLVLINVLGQQFQWKQIVLLSLLIQLFCKEPQFMTKPKKTLQAHTYYFIQEFAGT